MIMIERSTPFYTTAQWRPIRGIVLHHSAGSTPVECHREGSWHWMVDKDATVYRDVPEDLVAWGAGYTDRWRPSWVTHSPIRVSDVNWCGLHLEIVYAPQLGEAVTDAQYAAVAELVAAIYGRHGPLYAVGHGEIDSTKWPTEPHGFDWRRAGFGPLKPGHGRRWLGSEVPPKQEEVTVTDEERLALLERISALEADQIKTNSIKAEFEYTLRHLESRRRLRRGTTDHLIAKALQEV